MQKRTAVAIALGVAFASSVAVRAQAPTKAEFEKLMKESPAEFYSGAVWAKYAQAWSMVHFFETGADATIRERFRRYVQKIREGATGDEAFAAAWTGVKWPEVQKAWRQHVDGMKLR